MTDLTKCYAALLKSSLSRELADGLLNDSDIAAHSVYMAALREHSPYRSAIPEDIFCAYVLPMRVNDEPVVPCAKLLGKLFLPKLKELSMHDAAIKLNYICMSYVTYRFNDAPTHDAITIMKRGHGRCGEESVFAVLAYRSIGIPARQVYAPLWAHCDDNHGWVEVFVDGEWHFLGACEAEPQLDFGWFSGVASRALLVRTFSDYPVSRDEAYGCCNNRIAVNVTPRYADCCTVGISVVRGGSPVPNAIVHICIANDGAFKSAATLVCDNSGNASLTMGMGTAYAYVFDGMDGGFCFCQFCPAQSNSVVIDLKSKLKDGFYSYTQTVPIGRIGAIYTYTRRDKARRRIAKARYRLRMIGKSKGAWRYPAANDIRGTNTLLLNSDKPLVYGANVAVERLENGAFRRLDLRDRALDCLHLPDGRYRINTYIRELDGTLTINSNVVTLENSICQTLMLRVPIIRLSGMLKAYPLPQPYQRKYAILVWVQGMDEPAQHILNELSEKKLLLSKMGIEVMLIRRNPQLLLSIRKGLGIADNRLPLSVAVCNGNAVLGFTGYNVGTIDMLLQIIEWSKTNV